MRARTLAMGLVLALSLTALPAQAQQQAQQGQQKPNQPAGEAQEKARTPIPADMYCAGLVTKQAPSNDTVLITGEGSDSKITFQEGDYVYINKGANQGVKVNDEFSVIRPVSDPTLYPWFNWQFSIMNAIGTLWEDEGRVRVAVVHPTVSVAVLKILASTCSAAMWWCPSLNAPRPI